MHIRKSKKIPSIVISAHVLNKMNGDQFLNEVRKMSDEIIRIILTATDEPREVINLMQRSGAHIFVKKPFNSLEFMQIVRNLMTLHLQKIHNKKINDNLKKLEKEKKILLGQVGKYSSLSADEFTSIIKTISSLISGAERFNFVKHTHNVSQVSRKLAMRVGITEDRQKNIIYASLLANHYIIGLPDKLRLYDPRDIEDAELKKRFNNHFKESLANLLKIPSIKKYVEICAKLFENMDGTGEPMGKKAGTLPKEMQIIGLVNLYYNLVYRIKPDDLLKLKIEGKLYQSKKETLERHRSAITYLYKRLKWFDHDIFYKFQEMVKKQETEELKFVDRDLELIYDADDFSIPKFKNWAHEEYLMQKGHKERKVVQVVDENNRVIEEFIEKQFTLDKLEKGMILSKDVKNYSNATIIKSGTKLGEKHLATIQKYYETGNVPDRAFIKIEEL